MQDNHKLKVVLLGPSCSFDDIVPTSTNPWLALSDVQSPVTDWKSHMVDSSSRPEFEVSFSDPRIPMRPKSSVSCVIAQIFAQFVFVVNVVRKTSKHLRCHPFLQKEPRSGVYTLNRRLSIGPVVAGNACSCNDKAENYASQMHYTFSSLQKYRNYLHVGEPMNGWFYTFQSSLSTSWVILKESYLLKYRVYQECTTNVRTSTNAIYGVWIYNNKSINNESNQSNLKNYLIKKSKHASSRINRTNVTKKIWVSLSTWTFCCCVQWLYFFSVPQNSL